VERRIQITGELCNRFDDFRRLFGQTSQQPLGGLRSSPEQFGAREHYRDAIVNIMAQIREFLI
jgi:hypothetical protein